MHIKEFFTGFVKPGKEQNERTKGKMKALFLKLLIKQMLAILHCYMAILKKRRIL